MRRCLRNTRPARTSEASEPSALSLLLGQILNGIATGMLYALMGPGLALITGILNIPNFAHGALFAVGAYLLVTVVGAIGNFWLALLIAPLGVALLGIAIEYAGIRRLFTAAFALGAYLAGIAGALTAPIRGLSPGMGVDMLGIAFVVVALGGLGNLLGAIAAGLLIGVAQAVVAAYWTEASTAVIFAVMAAVLLVRPQGLFGIR